MLEAEVTGSLEHPGIVPVYGLGQYADGRPFYAMRFIKGDSLKDAIDKYHTGVKTGTLDQLGPATDVYSLGVTLYHVLTGRSPFDKLPLDELMERVKASEFPRPREINSTIPKALEAVCLQAMALQPADRYTNAARLGQEIERWLDDLPVEAYPEPLSIRSRRWIRTHQLPVATVAAMSRLVPTVTAW